jgi:hypothetical protein
VEGGQGKEGNMSEIYAVVNKVFCLFFEDKEDAENYLGKVATASNGLRLTTYFVIPRKGGKDDSRRDGQERV